MGQSWAEGMNVAAEESGSASLWLGELTAEFEALGFRDAVCIRRTLLARYGERHPRGRGGKGKDRRWL